MSTMQTEYLPATEQGRQRAAEVLRAGGLVAFPTETVYGLGGDASNGSAVAKIYEAKGRPSFNPLIVHVADAEMARRYVIWNDLAQALADAFWPGPLTLVLPLRPDAGVSKLVSAGLGSLAVRVPAHPQARELLHHFDGGMAGPSANPSGRISPTTAEHVRKGLDGRIDAVFDGGPCGVGIESTIIALLDQPTLLREGGLAAEAIETALGRALSSDTTPGKIQAPGQMRTHYAPGAKVRLNATDWREGELRLGFGPVDCDLNLSAARDLVEAAANLFGHLHALDAMQGEVIAVAPIPDEGLGRAINDRLRRAAAPRD